MAQITVMMAAYNTAQYLPRALDSILCQTFRDFDVIVTDDGSTDATGSIADDYAARDSRVHVLHRPNAGVCPTRNACLDWAYANSDSSWVIFADSDDWMHPEMLERLITAANQYDVKIVACGYSETTGADPVIDPKDLQPQVWDPMDFYQHDYVNAIMTCCKLYHKSCYEHIRHPLDNYFDDEFVSYRMLYAQQRMAVIPAPLYAYFINTAGLTKKPWTPKLLDAWVAYEEQIAFFRRQGRMDLVRFRYRGYYDNALTNREAARSAPDTPQIRRARRRIDRRLRQLLVRMWRWGAIEFWPDYEELERYLPIPAKLWRFWEEHRKK